MPTPSSLREGVKYPGSDEFRDRSECGERTIVDISEVFGVHRVRESPTEFCRGRGGMSISEMFNWLINPFGPESIRSFSALSCESKICRCNAIYNTGVRENGICGCGF